MPNLQTKHCKFGSFHFFFVLVYRDGENRSNIAKMAGGKGDIKKFDLEAGVRYLIAIDFAEEQMDFSINKAD